MIFQISYKGSKNRTISNIEAQSIITKFLGFAIEIFHNRKLSKSHEGRITRQYSSNKGDKYCSSSQLKIAVYHHTIEVHKPAVEIKT